jgi:hypothetical protein
MLKLDKFLKSQSQKVMNYDYIYITFLKWQHFRNTELNDSQGLGKEMQGGECGYKRAA